MMTPYFLCFKTKLLNYISFFHSLKDGTVEVPSRISVKTTNVKRVPVPDVFVCRNNKKKISLWIISPWVTLTIMRHLKECTVDLQYSIQLI